MTSSIRSRNCCRFAAAALFTVLAVAGPPAAAGEIDPVATAALKRMSDHLGDLGRFSVHTEADVEDLLDSGQRVDYAISAELTVVRPDKLRSERKGDPVDQAFYYDGRQLTLHDRAHQVYAKADAPPTIDQMFRFVQHSLGLVLPGSDLIYPDAYPLLMEGVADATVIGKSVIGGVSCDHLAFRRPGVDFQAWVADTGAPLPYKYIVTDTGGPALLSVSIVMSDWSAEPAVTDATFEFSPPPDVQEIPFMRIDADTGLGH